MNTWFCDDICLWWISDNKARFYVGLGRGVDTTIDVVEGAVCEMMRMSGARCVGSNERPQPACAMPRLRLVDNETGHGRPAIKQSSVKQNTGAGGKVGERLKSLDDGEVRRAEAQTAVH